MKIRAVIKGEMQREEGNRGHFLFLMVFIRNTEGNFVSRIQSSILKRSQERDRGIQTKSLKGRNSSKGGHGHSTVTGASST